VCTALADYHEKNILLSPLARLTLQLRRNTRQFSVNVYFTIIRATAYGRCRHQHFVTDAANAGVWVVTATNPLLPIPDSYLGRDQKSKGQNYVTSTHARDIARTARAEPWQGGRFHRAVETQCHHP
jgi:hypothetical protein